MTSKDRSGRTWTTIMWIELVPMSMAAMRMRGHGAQRVRLLLVTWRVIYLRTHVSAREVRTVASYHELPVPPVRRLLQRLAARPRSAICPPRSRVTTSACTRRGWRRGGCAKRCRCYDGPEGQQGRQGAAEDPALDPGARHRARARRDAAALDELAARRRTCRAPPSRTSAPA